MKTDNSFEIFNNMTESCTQCDFEEPTSEIELMFTDPDMSPRYCNTDSSQIIIMDNDDADIKRLEE